MCHQCRQKTLDQKSICRTGATNCNKSYCGVCLNNIYGVDLKVALRCGHWRVFCLFKARSKARSRTGLATNTIFLYAFWKKIIDLPSGQINDPIYPYLSNNPGPDELAPRGWAWLKYLSLSFFLATRPTVFLRWHDIRQPHLVYDCFWNFRDTWTRSGVAHYKTFLKNNLRLKKSIEYNWVSNQA